MATTVEHRVLIWNDDDGDRYEVCDDADGLGLTEIVYVDERGKRTDMRLSFTDEQVDAVIAALTERRRAATPAGEERDGNG